MIQKKFWVDHVGIVQTDDRGHIRDLLPPDVSVRHVGLITSAAGSVRGNHYHRSKDEWFFLVYGKATAAFRDSDGDLHSFVMEGGDRAFVPRGVTHSYFFHEESSLLDLGTETFDPLDVVHDEILTVEDGKPVVSKGGSRAQ